MPMSLDINSPVNQNGKGKTGNHDIYSTYILITRNCIDLCIRPKQTVVIIVNQEYSPSRQPGSHIVMLLGSKYHSTSGIHDNILSMNLKGILLDVPIPSIIPTHRGSDIQGHEQQVFSDPVISRSLSSYSAPIPHHSHLAPLHAHTHTDRKSVV